jgi:hypothetical protein
MEKVVTLFLNFKIRLKILFKDFLQRPIFGALSYENNLIIWYQSIIVFR